jgi:chromosome segregation ATPase
MVVEVSEIAIDGNVGSNAKISARKASIGGQTHKTATIEADELDINVHKGKAKGKNVHITRLEHGEVEGEIVNISQALGGHIRAKEITIQVCGSYVKATASKLIEIHKLQGSENIFTIDPLLKKDAAEGFSENEEGIKKLEEDIKSIHNEIEKLKTYIKTNTDAFNDLKKRLIHYKKNGVKLPESFVKKYQQFQKTTEHLKHITSEYERKNSQLTLLTTRTASFQDNIFDARIINRDKWTGHNEIRIKLVEPPVELNYVVPEGTEDKIFGLVELNEGEYMIRAVKE